jgi:hypothetical protein
MAATFVPDFCALLSRLSSAFVRTRECRDEGYSNLGGLGVSA